MSQTTIPYLEHQTRKILIPEVTLVSAFRPSFGSSHTRRLKYPNLEASVNRHRPFKEARQRRLSLSISGSLAHERAESELLKQELIECAWALQEEDDLSSQQLWAERFTKASTALFGAPNIATARMLARDRLNNFYDYSARPHVDPERLQRVCAFYERQLSRDDGSAKDLTARDESVFHDITLGTKQYFRKRFGRVLDALIGGDKLDLVVDPADIAIRFNRGLKVLQEDELMWRDWHVVMQDSGSLSVRCAAHRIMIGARREPMLLAALPGKFSHEVLVHALRQVNAKLLDDPKLNRGLPGYIDAEEGLACFVEYAVNGMKPRQTVERYLDIAFAMGLLDHKPVERRELFAMALDRKIVQDQAAGKQQSEAKVAAAIWEHVNRIYRGTRGEEVVGVFTKDVVYYNGFQDVTRYLLKESRKRPLAEVLEYLLSCKFNPFDKAQAEYVAESLAGRFIT